MDDEENQQQLPTNSPIYIIDDGITEITPLTDQPADGQEESQAPLVEPPLWTTSLLSEICREGNIAKMRDFTEYSRQTSRCGKHAAEIADRLEMETGLSPLHHAARHQQLHICLMLLSFISFKLGVNIKDANGRTPIHSAFRSSNNVRSKKSNAEDVFNIDTDFWNQIQEVEAWQEEYKTKILPSDHPLIYLFARANGDINARDKFRLTPLHYAAAQDNLAGVKQLITLGAELEATDRQGIRPLHLACKEGHVSIAEYLIEKGAEIDAIDDYNWTPLHYACSRGHVKIIELIHSKDEQRFEQLIQMSTSTKATCLHLAVQHGDIASIVYILDTVSEENLKLIINKLVEPLGTTLHNAAKYCDGEIMKLLSSKGGNPLILNSQGQSPLHIACIFNRLSIVKELLSLTGSSLLEIKDDRGRTALLLATNLDIIDTLISSHADLSSLDNNHMNVLMNAVSNKQISIVEHLLFVLRDQSIEIFNQVTRRRNRSVFLLAAQTGLVPICSLLLSCRYIRWDTIDKQRLNAFHIAAQKDHYEFIEYLCNFIGKSDRYSTLKSQIYSSTSDFDQINLSTSSSSTLRSYLDAQNEDGKTPLHLAAEQGHTSSVEVLLKYGADVLLPNYLGQLALHSAIQNSHTQCVDLLINRSIKNLADFQSVLSRRQSPLITACQNGFVDIVRLLLSQEIGLELDDQKDENPLEIAIKYRQTATIHELLDHSYRDTWLMPIRKTARGAHQTPLRDMIRFIPECAKHAFDTFIIKTNEINEKGETFERIIYNYKYIDDYFVNDNTLYAKTNRELYRNHPFIIALDNEHHSLLDHPLSRQLIQRKWKLYRPYFFLNLILAMLLLFLVTFYVLILPSPKSTSPETFAISSMSKFHLPVQWIIVSLAGINFLKIIHEIILYRGLRVPFAQLFEMIAYITSIIAFLPYQITNEPHSWQWQLAALSILFQWFNISFILRSVSFFGKCIVMVQSVLINILSLILVILPLFIAFTIAKHMIFFNQTSFVTTNFALHKLTAMVVGEFDYETLFFSKPTFQIAAFVFIPFIGILTIAFMNLLLGLTVGDIQMVMEKAQSKANAYRIREMIYIESTIPRLSQLKKNITECDIVDYNPKDLILMKSEQDDGEEDDDGNESLVNRQQNSQPGKLLDILNMLCTQAQQVLEKQIYHERLLKQLLRAQQTQTSIID